MQDLQNVINSVQVPLHPCPPSLNYQDYFMYIVFERTQSSLQHCFSVQFAMVYMTYETQYKPLILKEQNEPTGGVTGESEIETRPVAWKSEIFQRKLEELASVSF